jgi:hypothetical protein
MTDLADLARCLHEMLDSGYFQAIARGEVITTCAMADQDARITDAIKILWIVRDKLDFIAGNISLNDPVIECLALVNSAIKTLAD